MTGYVRQSAADIVPTAVVRAAPINNELNALRDAFVANGGHKHDGTAAEGHPVPVMGDSDLMNKIATDTSNNRHGVFVEVGGVAVEQVRFQDGAIVPVTDNDVDLGTSSNEFKNLYITGVANVDSLVADTADINGGTVDAAVIGATTPAAGTFTNLTANTSLVATTADINAGTIDGTVIGGAAAQAITGTTVTATTGFVGGLTGNVTGNTTGTHTGGVIGNVTGDVTGNVTASTGTSSFNDVTINGTLNMNAGTSATITNLTSPTNSGDAATKGYVDTADALKLNLSGGTMSGAIAMGTNKITGLGTPTANADAATKVYVDTSISNLVASAPGLLDTLDELAAALGDDPNFATTVTNSIATKLPLAGGTMSGAIAMGTNKITGLGDPTLAQDAATKTYVDTADALKLNLSGGTMSGAIAMGTNKITGLGNPTANQDAATKTYVDTADALKLSLTGGTMSGAIAMGTSKITGLGDPTANQDAATKIYVDGILGSATSAATSAASAATSASNAATSASNASTSASNAATSASSASTSATNAAASYDAFDDRYLGSKTSAPTLDNDGNALLTGALYWNSTSNELYLWTGSAWTRSALSGTDYVAKSGDTMTGALTTTALTLSGGTANGVTYLNGSKVLTSGSALTFDGTTLALNNATPIITFTDTGNAATYSEINCNNNTGTMVFGADRNNVSSGSFRWEYGGSEQMRLTSTGLGIGTSSPNAKLDVVGGNMAVLSNTAATAATASTYALWVGNSATRDMTLGSDATYSYIQSWSGKHLYLNSQGNNVLVGSGNVGIGTSSPAVKLDVAGAINATAQITVNTADGANQIRLQTAGVTKWVNYTQSDGLRWYNTADRMTLDSAGNLGLGVTPSAWGSGWIGLQIGLGAGLVGRSGVNNQVQLVANAYYNGTNWIYKNTDSATQYFQTGGYHAWGVAPSGTAGNAITFTQAMTLDASGLLGLGITAPTQNGGGASKVIHINGSGSSDWATSHYTNGTTGTTGSDGFVVGLLGSGDAYLFNYEASNLIFATSAAERARIDSSGNLLVGTTTAAAKLTIASTTNPALTLPNIAEIATVSATAATGTINYDLTTQSVLYYTTNASGNFTMNIRGNSGLSLNSMMSTGQSVTMAFLCTNGSTAYYQSAMTIDGTSVTPKWQGGTAPTTGNASAIDSYVYTVIKTGAATFTVLASQTKFA